MTCFFRFVRTTGEKKRGELCGEIVEANEIYCTTHKYFVARNNREQMARTNQAMVVPSGSETVEYAKHVSAKIDDLYQKVVKMTHVLAEVDRKLDEILHLTKRARHEVPEQQTSYPAPPPLLPTLPEDLFSGDIDRLLSTQLPSEL